VLQITVVKQHGVRILHEPERKESDNGLWVPPGVPCVAKLDALSCSLPG
jgi:hypothetical protein